jgi:hypothetical protein
MRVVISLIAVISVSALLTAGGAAAKPKPSSQCRNISTYEQAARAGELPAIGAALHGGAPIVNPLVSCGG